MAGVPLADARGVARVDRHRPGCVEHLSARCSERGGNDAPVASVGAGGSPCRPRGQLAAVAEGGVLQHAGLHLVHRCCRGLCHGQLGRDVSGELLLELSQFFKAFACNSDGGPSMVLGSEFLSRLSASGFVFPPTLPSRFLPTDCAAPGGGSARPARLRDRPRAPGGPHFAALQTNLGSHRGVVIPVTPYRGLLRPASDGTGLPGTSFRVCCGRLLFGPLCRVGPRRRPDPTSGVEPRGYLHMRPIRRWRGGFF